MEILVHIYIYIYIYNITYTKESFRFNLEKYLSTSLVDIRCVGTMSAAARGKEETPPEQSTDVDKQNLRSKNTHGECKCKWYVSLTDQRNEKLLLTLTGRLYDRRPFCLPSSEKDPCCCGFACLSHSWDAMQESKKQPHPKLEDWNFMPEFDEKDSLTSDALGILSSPGCRRPIHVRTTLLTIP